MWRFDPEGGPMMRRAGTPQGHIYRLTGKSYYSEYCLEGQISIGLVLLLPAHAPAFPGRTRHRCANAGTFTEVVGR